jgi:hypothetical protein
MKGFVMKWLIGGVFVGLIVVAGALFTMMYFSTSNKEIKLRNQASAQETENKTEFDKMTKTILQLAQINEKFAEDFKQTIIGNSEARYNGKDPAMLFITEQNPTLPQDTYLKIMNAIEALRAEFQQRQTKLISIAQEHKNLLTMFPSSLFLSGRQPLDIKIVTSTNTEKAFSTGKEDDIKIYGK